MTRFAGRGPLRLSTVATLERSELEQLLAILDEVLVAPRAPNGARRARSSDGRFEIVLRPPANERSWVVLETASGRLRCLDYELEVSPAARAQSAAGGAVP
jgi:hypothetical protein